jgi:hypothetical protein
VVGPLPFGADSGLVTASTPLSEIFVRHFGSHNGTRGGVMVARLTTGVLAEMAWLVLI